MMVRTDTALVCVVLVMLEISCYIGAKESRVMQHADDYRSLELCVSRRTGSVFGNYTRHHKMVHRRRTTTTTLEPTTFDYTTEDHSTVSSIARTRREVTYEQLMELSEMALAKSAGKVKRMYRGKAGSSQNRLAHKGGGQGIFLTDNCTTVVAQIGSTAMLHCEVSDITENTVTWIRRKDYSLLSVGLVTYSADTRFFSAHGHHVKDWALHVRFASSADAGYYECQVPTHPPTSILFKLVLVAAFAEISGESEKIIHEGSMLRLVCELRRSTEPPSYVFWYFENRMINYELNGVMVSNGRHSSVLTIDSVELRHAGNYTCMPANAKAASVTVHVVQTENPAAMQHGHSGSFCRRFTLQMLFFFITLLVILTK